MWSSAALLATACGRLCRHRGCACCTGRFCWLPLLRVATVLESGISLCSCLRHAPLWLASWCTICELRLRKSVESCSTQAWSDDSALACDQAGSLHPSTCMQDAVPGAQAQQARSGWQGRAVHHLQGQPQGFPWPALQRAPCLGPADCMAALDAPPRQPAALLSGWLLGCCAQQRGGL